MGLLGGLSVITFIGLLILAVGLLLHIIGLTTPNWSEAKDYDKVHTGLFQICYPVGRAVNCTVFGDVSDEHKACRAFALLGVGLAVAGFVLALLNIFLGPLGVKQSKLFPLSGGVCCFATTASVLLACILWAATLHDSNGYVLGYSFVLSILGGVLVGIAGVPVIIGGLQVL